MGIWFPWGWMTRPTGPVPPGPRIARVQVRSGETALKLKVKTELLIVQDHGQLPGKAGVRVLLNSLSIRVC